MFVITNNTVNKINKSLRCRWQTRATQRLSAW